jgi:hypothetical protein
MSNLDLREIAKEARENRIESILRSRGEPEPEYEYIPEPREKKRSYATFLKRFFLGICVLVLLAAVGTGGYIALKHYSAPEVASTDEILSKVGKLAVLPEGETPTIATVSDLAPLKGQEFFKDAAVGDKVIIYAESMKAILYRPSSDSIIIVAPIHK